MEKILNKIDDNLRSKINEITKDGKIHSVKENKINTDTEYRQENNDKSKVIKKVYLIDAVKKEKYEVEAFEVQNNKKILGKFLDVKE